LEESVSSFHILLMLFSCLWVFDWRRTYCQSPSEGGNFWLLYLLDKLLVGWVKEDLVLSKEVKANEEVVLAAIRDEHESVWVHYSV